MSTSHSVLLSAAKRVNLAETIRDQLAHLVLSGKVPPGERLPPEHELCRQLGVGRTSLREAIRALQALGLVEVRHGKGTYVHAGASRVVPYSAWPGAYRVTINDVFELRLAIEPHVAALAAARHDPAALEAIEASLTAMELGLHNEDLAAMVLADLAFHRHIVEASRNLLFVDVMERTSRLRIESLRTSLSRPGRVQRVLAFHRNIFDAIRRLDSNEAADTMRAHVLNWAREMGVQQGSE